MEKNFKKEKEPKMEMSLVERQRQEALDIVLDTLAERFPTELKMSFESHGKKYSLTSAEDCMVAFAQQNREAVEALADEIKDQDNYRAEQAIAKLFALFMAYEKTVALYAELRSYYPTAAARVEVQLPPLSNIAEHGVATWKQISK
ncbi:MAG: hypothetical protein R3B53_00110 [Candidatus Paceibacterota bacterium]